MEDRLEDYRRMVSQNEDLKSEERVLNVMRTNLKQMREMLIQKEECFCEEDRRLRSLSDIKASLGLRCCNLIDHLVHYKCIIECLATDILNMESNILNDDEYISLSLTYRQVELVIMKAIRTNQQRNALFSSMRADEGRSHLLEIESKWRQEHSDNRKLMTRLLMDHNDFVVDKTRINLSQQQSLLNKRHQLINHLIKLA